MLLVNEIFDSIQGEGYFIGVPSTFIRLQGCSVGCHFCDTKHTWSKSPKMLSQKIIPIQKTESTNEFAVLSVKEIIENCNESHVVITGGEPLEQDITELLVELVKSGKSVQIETSGSVAFTKMQGVWYTVSPKFTKNTDTDVVLASCYSADELKVIASSDYLDVFEKVSSSKNKKAVLLFQVESCKKESYALALKLSKMYKGKVSIQTHKYIGVR